MFTYGVMVLVISGFYKGCHGYVIDHNPILPKYYTIELYCPRKDFIFSHYVGKIEFTNNQLREE